MEMSCGAALGSIIALNVLLGFANAWAALALSNKHDNVNRLENEARAIVEHCRTIAADYEMEASTCPTTPTTS